MRATLDFGQTRLKALFAEADSRLSAIEPAAPSPAVNGRKPSRRRLRRENGRAWEGPGAAILPGLVLSRSGHHGNGLPPRRRRQRRIQPRGHRALLPDGWPASRQPARRSGRPSPDHSPASPSATARRQQYFDFHPSCWTMRSFIAGPSIHQFENIWHPALRLHCPTSFNKTSQEQNVTGGFTLALSSQWRADRTASSSCESHFPHHGRPFTAPLRPALRPITPKPFRGELQSRREAVTERWPTSAPTAPSLR